MKRYFKMISALVVCLMALSTAWAEPYPVATPRPRPQPRPRPTPQPRPRPRPVPRPRPIPRPRPVPAPRPAPRPTPPRHAIVLEGELTPYSPESKTRYVAYTVVIEEYRHRNYPDFTMTLYPRIVCKQHDGCPGYYAPAPSQLQVNQIYQNSCDSGVYEGFDIRGYVDPISSVILSDNYGDHCGIADELTADITYADGYRERLIGYRTY